MSDSVEELIEFFQDELVTAYRSGQIDTLTAVCDTLGRAIDDFDDSDEYGGCDVCQAVTETIISIRDSLSTLANVIRLGDSDA